jgi:hypothetical protein
MAAALALLLVAGPLLGGVLLGKLLQRRRAVAFGILAVTAVTLAAVINLQQVGVWDFISAGVLGIAGLIGGAGIDRRDAPVLLLSSALAVVVLEAATRLWLPSPPQYPDPHTAALILEPAAWDAGCSVLYGTGGVDDDVHVLRGAPSDSAARRSAPLVVHLGDSMTYGEGVNAEETFAALLDARQTGRRHRNYGVWAVGTDFEYLLLRRVLAEHSPVTVVVHVYTGNDIHDIDRPYACCEAGPLLVYEPGGPRPRCEDARWSFPLAYRLSRSPPPYPLRVATHWSSAARHGAAAFSRLASRFEPRADFIRTEGEATDVGWQHFAQILTKLRDDLAGKAELIVNLLPTRQALEAADPATSPAYRAGRRAATIVRGLGIRTLDAWDVFAKAVRRDGSRRYFRGEQDIHLTPEGHRLLAYWLEAALSSDKASNQAH